MSIMQKWISIRFYLVKMQNNMFSIIIL